MSAATVGADAVSAALLLAGLVLLALAVHPFTTYPLSLRLLARLRPHPLAGGASRAAASGASPGASPGASVGTAALCVCAYNEEPVIRAKAENMLAMRAAYPGLELLVYVDGASDRTADILRGYDGAIRVVESPVRTGKTQGMNTLVGLTGAEFVAFSDANVTFAPDALPRLLAPFADPAVGCVCGHLVYTGAGGTATAATGSLYWRLEEHIKALESATGSVMGADGSIFALRRCLHEPPPPDLIDDMYVSLAVLCAGRRIVRAGDAVAYEEAVSRPGEEWRRKIRIACQAFNVHRTLRRRLRALPAVERYKYVSHKLLRWLTIYLLAAGAACVVAGLALAQVWAVLACVPAAVVAGLALMARVRRGPVAAVQDALGAFVATGIGVWRSLRGERFQTWNPPASARALAGAEAQARLAGNGD